MSMLVVLCCISIDFFTLQMDVDSGKCLQCPGTCKSSNFRERLMKYLRRPYDQNEYNCLLEEASFCRERLRWRELRNGVLKSYSLGSRTKSYLDLYDGEYVQSQCNFILELH